MAIIDVRVPNSQEVLKFEIAGEKPTEEETKIILDEINKSQVVIPNIRISPEKQREKKILEEQFDTKTGIRDPKLRAALSLADIKKEKEKILQSFGVGEDEFTYDPRGRLALTPTGAKKFGVESDKNVLIDESGFTSTDLIDFAGFAPEVAGAVIGAVKGQVAIPIPVLGAAIGAAGGAGAANLLEEGLEKILGTAAQTPKQVAIQTGKEAAIAGFGELLFGAPIFAIKKLISSPAPKKGTLSDEKIKVIQESKELGITPSLSQMGAPPLLARQQELTERIYKTSARLKKNQMSIDDIITEFRQFGEPDPTALGQAVVGSAKKTKKDLFKKEKEIQTKILNQLNDVSDNITESVKYNVNLSDDLANAFSKSYANFENEATRLFTDVDVILNDPKLANFKLFNTNGLKRIAVTDAEKLQGVSALNEAGKVVSVLDAIKRLDTNSNYVNLYNLRKDLVKNRINFIKKDSEEALTRLINEIDNITDITSIDKIKSKVRVGLTDEKLPKLNIDYQPSAEDLAKFRQAAKTAATARQFYKEGMDAFEALEKNNVFKSIKLNKGNIPENFNYGVLLQRDKPTLIKEELKNALLDETGKVDTQLYDTFFRQLQNRWLTDTLTKSFDPTKPNSFSGSYLKTEIDKLGKTFDALFPDNANEVKNLANQLENLNIKGGSNIDIVEDFKSKVNIDDPNVQTTINALEDLKNQQQEIFDFQNNVLLKKLADKKITESDAVKLITQKTLSENDTKQVMNLLKNQVNSDELVNNIRASYMENLIQDFGDNFLQDPKSFGLFAKRIKESDNKLDIIFDKDLAEKIKKFGRVLELNSKTAEAGSLVAANIAASPLQNLGKLIRFSIIGRALSSDLFYKNFDKALKKGEPSPNALALALTQFITQLTEENVSEGIRQTESLLGDQLDKIKSEINFPTPSSDLGGLNITAPNITTPTTPTPTVGPQSNLRQRIKDDPAAANVLLGGLGSAGLA